MDDQSKQSILDLPKVIAIGIASPLASFLTSRFGIAGTLVGLALGAVILTVVTDFLKVYLRRTSHAAAHAAAHAAHTAATAKVSRKRDLPLRLFRRKSRAGPKRAFHGFFLHPHPRGGSVLIGSVLTAGSSFLLGLGVVTAIELSAGQSLACWVWKECPVESPSAEPGEETEINTRPSILGGTSVSSDASRVQPLNPQQHPASPPPGLGVQPAYVQQEPASPPPGPGVQPAYPSYIPEESSPAPSEVPSLEGKGSGEPTQEAWEQSPPREEDKQQNPSYYYHFEEEQHNPPSSVAPEEPKQPDDRASNSNSSGSDRESWEPEER